jgi:hypothetical protein
MMKPDFNTMTRKELKQYVLAHPTDDEAIRELFIKRRGANAKIYPSPYQMQYEEVEKIFTDHLKINQENKNVLRDLDNLQQE